MFSIYGFILFAITVEANLYVTCSSKIGLQFFRKRLSLVSFGRHIIIAGTILFIGKFNHGFNLTSSNKISHTVHGEQIINNCLPFTRH